MIIKEYDIGSNFQRNSWNRRVKQGKIKAEFSNEQAAEQYINYLKSKGIDAEVHPYTLGGDVSYIVDINRHKPINNESLNRINKLKEFWLDDEDELDAGDVAYEAKAYYNSRYSGLADSETFANGERSELNDWIWEMCQRGFYVTVYDYEDGDYSYYRWPDNGEYMDLCEVGQLETDERGNFLYIDDIGPR